MRHLITICFLLLSGVLFSQHKVDSLLAAIKTHPADSTLVNLKIQLSLAYYNIDLKKSLRYGDEALAIAQMARYEYGEQQSLSVLSRIQRRLGNFSVAIEYNLQQIPIAIQRNDLKGVADAYTTLGNIHSSLENYKEARKNLLSAYAISSPIKTPHLSAIMNFLGRNYGKMKMYDSAIFWITKAHDYETQHPQPGYVMSYIYNNLAEVYNLKGEYNKAIEYYTKAQRLPDENKSPFGEAFTLNGLGISYKELGHYQEAIRLLQASLTISSSYGYRDKTKEAYGILFEIYEHDNDYKNALMYYKRFNVYEDSIFSEDKLQYIENLKSNFASEQILHENELLKKDAELKDAGIAKQKSYTILSIILVVSISGAFAFLYYRSKQHKKQNKFLAHYNSNLESQVENRTKELLSTNLELIKQNDQLEQFGYMTAHNLRAPVARILGLANIFSISQHTFDEDAFILEKIQLTARELDDIIHDMSAILDIKKGIDNTYELVDFHERIGKIRSILKEIILTTEATLEEDFTAASSGVAVPAYIESIFYNLISNALKYRSPKRTPQIKIKSELIDNKLYITFSDNGIGIDLKNLRDKVFNLYQRFHTDIEGKGIGLFLVKTQVEAMDGKIELESEVNRGTTFRFFIPQRTVPIVMSQEIPAAN